MSVMIATTWVLVLLWARAAAGGDLPLDATGEPPPRCLHARCLHNDTEIEIAYSNELGYLSMDCNRFSESESSVMPCADCEYTVWQVVMNNCLLPATLPILDTLNRLNVTMLYNETEEVRKYGKLTLDVPESILIAENFAGLERLWRLEIRALQNNQVRAELNFLAPLKSLRELKIEGVQLPDGEPNSPSGLQELSLIRTSVKRLPAAVYASSSLSSLTVESNVDLDAVAIPPELQSLELKSPATKLLVKSMPALTTLHIANWTETMPEPLENCSKLNTTYLTSPAISYLPNNWLASCQNVTILVIEKALNLRTLPERLFGVRNKTIERIAIKEGVLEELNWEQFNEGESESELVKLELNGNRLRTIPNSTLSLMLMKLDLSSNDLDSSVLEVLGSTLFEAIAHIDLSNNPRLGDVCDHNGYSALASLHSLKKVLLDNTNVSRLCRDWRENLPALQELGLRNTSITKLTVVTLVAAASCAPPADDLGSRDGDLRWSAPVQLHTASGAQQAARIPPETGEFPVTEPLQSIPSTMRLPLINIPDSEVQTTTTADSTPPQTTKKEDNTEPSHTDLKKMLDDYKAEQKLNYSSLENKVKELIQLFSALRGEVNKQVHNLNHDIKNNQVAQVIEDKLENIERYQRATSLVIANVPQEKGETKDVLTDIILRISEVINIALDISDIKNVFRVNTNSVNISHKLIVVDFVSVLYKEKFSKAIKAYNKEDRHEKLNTKVLGIEGPAQPLLVYENLTLKARKLLNLSRDFAKKHNYKYCWSSRGKVYLRKSDGTALIPVNSELDLIHLKEKQ